MGYDFAFPFKGLNEDCRTAPVTNPKRGLTNQLRAGRQPITL